ncbi:reverse transcriptase domain-containing protein [Dysgonomonas sp. GY617]|uniref:reverse transcriptase domain-containing protein n=1 Tax=Dysgonomonas sp. GY617 TaxID=2780420 RepID=UPI00188458A5|nr:reverse transcriptase domain-containing protein [Dysgonomonas sp. GY617]MBF0577555.1 hypothetical protein [Dysgonomonas sp. GY617]
METEKSLLEQLSSKDNLYQAWELLNKENEYSRGLSGLTIEKFRENLESNIDDLNKKIKEGTFQFSKTRAAIIKKGNGKYRPLQIPEIGDRVVLKTISILLEEQLAEILKESDNVSFAYQRDKGVREGVLKMKSCYQQGNVILKADIINFFEEVQIDKLLNEHIYPNLKDNSLNKLIKESITQKLGGLNYFNTEQKQLFKNAGTGIPQGNPLSPLLSNIYLSDFDRYLIKSDYSLIRYADDFVVIFKSEEEAIKGYEVISTYLKDKFSLQIHPLEANNGKTQIIDPTKKEMSFLSIKFDGINIYPSKEAVRKLKGIITDIVKNGNLNSNLFDDIYQTINKWVSIYSYLDIERYFNDIDTFLINQLSKKFGKIDYKTKKCKHLANQVRINQCTKSSKSFWRNFNLRHILPKISWKRKKKG